MVVDAVAERQFRNTRQVGQIAAVDNGIDSVLEPLAIQNVHDIKNSL